MRSTASMSMRREPARVAHDLELLGRRVEDRVRPARCRSARARRLPPWSRRGRVVDLPDGSPTIAVKSPMISTAMWPRSWKQPQPPQHHREAEVDVGCGRVDPELHPQRPAAARASAQLGLRRSRRPRPRSAARSGGRRPRRPTVVEHAPHRGRIRQARGGARPGYATRHAWSDSRKVHASALVRAPNSDMLTRRDRGCARPRRRCTARRERDPRRARTRPTVRNAGRAHTRERSRPATATPGSAHERSRGWPVAGQNVRPVSESSRSSAASSASFAASSRSSPPGLYAVSTKIGAGPGSGSGFGPRSERVRPSTSQPMTAPAYRSQRSSVVIRASAIRTCSVRPPSTGMIAPFTNDDAGSARFSTIWATSSGSPYRRSGTRRRANFCLASSGIGAVMPVLIGPGTDAVHRDPAGTQLGGERTREAHDTVLRRGVRRDVGRRAETLGRGDVHDPARAVGEEVRQARSDHAHVAGQVHREREIPRGLEVVAVDRRGETHSGVVHEDPDGTELGDRHRRRRPGSRRPS